MKPKSVAIISSGYFPIPPVKGGAIETLVNILYEENREKQIINLSIYSMYDKDAKAASNVTANNNIVYIKIPSFIRLMDRLLYFVFKNILRKKKHMSYRYIFQRLYYINAVSKDITLKYYDSIIVENHPTLLGILRKWGNSEKYKGKCYYHAHNEILKTFGYKKELKELQGFICVSKYIGNSIHKTLPDYPLNKIKVLRNRVDEDKFRGVSTKAIETFRVKYNIPTGFILFTFTGRLNPEKGVKELLQAYKKAHPENSKLVIAGSYYFGSEIKSAYEEELRRVSEEIKEDIIFTGHIEYNDMPCMYAVSDVIVLPSIWNDPAPLTIIESLTCGKPLITTYSGGIPEYANTRNAVMLKSDGKIIDNLAMAISRLASDVKKRTELIDNAKNDSKHWRKIDYYLDFINLLEE